MFKRALFSLSAAALISLTASPFAAAGDTEEDAAIAAAIAALDAQLPGKLINNPYDIKWRTDGSDRKASVVKSEGAPGGMAYRVTVKKTKKNPWDTATRIPMMQDINKDDVILFSFWARAAKPPKGKETGDIGVNIQRNIEPYDSVLEDRIALGTDWKLYNVAGTAARKFSQDKTQINFNLARAKQTVEFGQFYVMNLGPGADASKYMK
jgi:type II secretory pathway pseudopilin PulG